MAKREVGNVWVDGSARERGARVPKRVESNVKASGGLREVLRATTGTRA